MTEQVVTCPECGEVKKFHKSKVFFDPLLSDKSKGRFVYFCTNHEPQNIHWVYEKFVVKNVIISIRQYVFEGRLPKK